MKFLCYSDFFLYFCIKKKILILVMYQLDLPDKVYKNINLICKENQFTDINSVLLKIIEIGFNVMKYGTTPFKYDNMKTLSKEQIKDEIKEIQVEQQEIKPKKVRIIKK